MVIGISPCNSTTVVINGCKLYIKRACVKKKSLGSVSGIFLLYYYGVCGIMSAPRLQQTTLD